MITDDVAFTRPTTQHLIARGPVDKLAGWERRRFDAVTRKSFPDAAITLESCQQGGVGKIKVIDCDCDAGPSVCPRHCTERGRDAEPQKTREESSPLVQN